MARRHNIIIVGGGLFGCIAAELARFDGHHVTVIDDARPYRASPASGCVLAPSWLTSLEKPQVETAMGVLGDLYTLHDLEFHTNLLKKFKAKRVATDDVLKRADLQARVLRVGDGWVEHEEPHSAGTQRTGKLRGTVLVAAGIWCGELLKDLPAIQGLYGCSLRIPGQLEYSKLSVYAPYRQAVAFNMTKKHVWFGDGTALVEKTWTAEERERINASMDRAKKTVGLGVPPGTRHIIGARPYVAGHKAGYFAQVSPRTWVSTGGAKNGTVLAAWQAYRFWKEALK